MHIHTIQLNIETLEGGTQEMDATEFGAYMRLIIACYKSNNKLTDDDVRLARIAKVSTRIWKKIKPVLEPKFQIKDGLWSHERVSKELLKCRLLSQKNKANALKNNKTAKPVASQSHSQTRANTNNNKQITNNYILPPIIPQGIWDEWINYRKEKKKSLTLTTIEKQLKQLSAWHDEGYGVEEIINQSIRNGWIGLFKPKEQKNAKSKSDYIIEGHERVMDKYRNRNIE